MDSATILQKVLTSLAPLISGGIITKYLLEPWHTRRVGKAEADTEAYKRLVLAQNEKDVEAIKKGELALNQGKLTAPPKQLPTATQFPQDFELSVDDSWDLPDFAQAAAIYEQNRSVQRYININTIASEAIKYAASKEEANLTESNATEQSVDPNWFWHWRSHAENVIEDEMRLLWAKLFVEEVNKPGQFSLRTLQLISTLSKNDAELIEEIAPFISHKNSLCISSEKLLKEYLVTKNITFSKFLKLQDLGLISGVGGLVVHNPKLNKNTTQVYKFGSFFVRCEVKTDFQLEVNNNPLTQIGSEIFQLINAEADIGFVHGFAHMLLDKNPNIKIVIYRIYASYMKSHVDILATYNCDAQTLALFARAARDDFNNLPLADKLLKQAIQKNPKDPIALHGYALLLIHDYQNYNWWHQIFQKLLEVNELEPLYWANYSQLCFITGDISKAKMLSENAFKLVAQLNPTDIHLELWFYYYMHLEENKALHLRKIKELLIQDIRSVGWNFEANIKKSKKDGHPSPELMSELSEVILDKTNIAELNQFEAWRSIKI